jgi:Putative porin
MFVKKTIVTALSLGFAFAANADDASDLKDLKEIVAKQQAQLETLNKQVKEQDTSNKEAVAQYVKTEVDTQMKAQKSLLTLGKHISAFKISGDLRLRYQHEDTRDGIPGGFDTGAKTNAGAAVKGDSAQRDRFRQRLRIGMNWESKDEMWEVGARLVSGSSDGRSTNDTYGDEAGSNAYEHGDLRIDMAYAKLKFSTKEDDFNSALTMGQQSNAYKTNWIFMDTDLNPVGITYQYDMFTDGANAEKKPDEHAAWFNTFGVYTVDHRNDGKERSDVFLMQGQTGYRNDTALIALGYSHYGANASDLNLNGVSDAGDIRKGSYTYDIANISGEYYLVGDRKIEKNYAPGAGFALKASAEYAKNLGANNEDSQNRITGTSGIPPKAFNNPNPAGLGEDQAYFLSIDSKYDQYRAGFGWAHVEQDALPKFLVDSDYASGNTGYEGLFFKIGMNITKNLELNGTATLAKTINENSVQRDQLDLYQLDMVWKF